MRASTLAAALSAALPFCAPAHAQSFEQTVYATKVCASYARQWDGRFSATYSGGIFNQHFDDDTPSHAKFLACLRERGVWVSDRALEE
jgi:hypothetical protein